MIGSRTMAGRTFDLGRLWHIRPLDAGRGCAYNAGMTRPVAIIIRIISPGV